MTISARISNALKEKGIPQKAIAEAVDVAASTVSTWMKSNGDNIPSGYIMPICRLLDMQPEELLEGAEHRDVIEIIPDDAGPISFAGKRWRVAPVPVDVAERVDGMRGGIRLWT